MKPVAIKPRELQSATSPSGALLLTLLGAITLLSACAIVPRYQREAFAHPGMVADGDDLSARSFRKMRTSREGAAGGDVAVAGGGCACGQ